MPPFDPLLADVAEAALADWGRPVTLLTSEPAYDPDAGTLAAAESPTAVTAIVSDAPAAARPGTAHMDRPPAPTLLVRAADLPPAGGRLRVDLDGRRHTVLARNDRPGGLTALTLAPVEPAA